MKHNHIYSILDSESIVGRILATLSGVPLEAREKIVAEVHHRLMAEPKAVRDQDINVLHEWGVLSTRCFTTLTRSLRSNGKDASDQSIRLSDVAQLSSTEISTISNLGKQSRTEILSVLEIYGFRPQGSHSLSQLSNVDKQTVREKMITRMAEHSTAQDCDRALVKELSMPDADWPAAAVRLGCSERMLRNKVTAAIRRIAFYDANPVLPPDVDLSSRI